MTYQIPKVIQSQTSLCRMTTVILFNPYQKNEGVHTFPRGLRPKVNIKARLDYELSTIS